MASADIRIRSRIVKSKIYKQQRPPATTRASPTTCEMIRRAFLKKMPRDSDKNYDRIERSLLVKGSREKREDDMRRQKNPTVGRESFPW